MSVRVWFVRDPGGGSEFHAENVENEMENAHHICEQYKSNGMEAEWLTAEECHAMSDVSKRDVFVLPRFAGPVYERLIKTKAVVIGPRCLSCCLTEGCEIPPGPHPVYTIAMKGLIVSMTSLKPDVKKQLGQKIEWMGGTYESILTAETTHVIANSVFSEKYNKAVTLGIPIMKAEWVQAAWEESLIKNVSASGSDFDKYRLPIFYNINMCSTGLKKAEKNKLQKVIVENGGQIHGVMDVQKVNILITDSSGVGSDKFKAAQTYDIPCISLEWIYKSIEKGYPLPFKEFMIVKNKTSSPNRPSQLPNMTLDISMIPNVKNETGSTIISDETGALTPMNKIFTKRGRPNKLSAIAKDLAQLVDAIEIKEVKQAGSFMDGCCIFVYGLNATRRDKLQRAVGRAGAVCYNQPSESVTHALCGDPSAANSDPSYKTSMPRAVHVTVKWFTDGLAAKKTVAEEPYLVFNNDASSTNSKKLCPTMASPMSKRNLQLLRTPSKLPPVPKFNLDEEPEVEKDEIVQQYLEHHKSQQSMLGDITELGMNEPKDKTLACDNDREKTTSETLKMAEEKVEELISNENEEMEEQIFEGLKFEIQDIDEEREQIKERIVNAGGTVVISRKKPNYIIVPINCDDVQVLNHDAEVVTTVWLEDCFLKEKVVEIDYYHRPIKIDSNSKPLAGLVFAISTYSGNEREFILEVAGLLGGTVQSSLHRKTTTNALRSTHLICSEASGAKYNGAVGWGIPVVTSQWLMDCAEANKRIPEEPYLVGANNTVNPNKTDMKKSIATINEESGMTKVGQSENPMENVIENMEVAPEIGKAPSEDTPKAQRKLIPDDPPELSPVSRYVAMARQGLLGAESQTTPKRQSEVPPLPSSQKSNTPPLDNALSTPNISLFSPADRRRLLAIKRGERPSNPPCTPKNPLDVSIVTPESPFGAFLKRNDGEMSNKKPMIKRIWKFIEDLDPPTENNKNNVNSETPVSEVCRKYLNQMSNNDVSEKPSAARMLDIKETETPPPKIRKLDTTAAQKECESSGSQLQNQLKQLNSILAGNDDSSSTTPRSLRSKRSLNAASPALSLAERNPQPMAVDQAQVTESQHDTVKWDDMSEFSLKTEIKPAKVYRFMLSLNVGNGEEYTKIIERLGGTVLTSSNLDLSATHLLCSRAMRSEKFLGCLASGRWILHPSYVLRSQEAGRFVDEELYEWGNPKADNLLGSDDHERRLASAVHRWRTRISETGVLPFSSFRVIMHIQEERKESLMRVLLAGGGKVVNASPPFIGDVNATHCLMEHRRLGLRPEDMAYLAARRIPVCPPLLLNSILVEDPPPDAMEASYPEYKKLLKS